MGRAKSTTRIDKAAATKLAASFFAAPSGLVLDTKSTYSTTADLDALVNALATQYGIHVFGVGSFIRSQISGLTATKPVYFYHTHFGLALEAQAGLVKNGDTVMSAGRGQEIEILRNGENVRVADVFLGLFLSRFNGGSLLVQGAATPTVDPTAIAALRAVQQQYKLNVALYVQEPATSPAAATALINLTNQETALLSGGFAYGNVNGRADGLAKGDALGVQSPLYTMEKLKTQAKQVVAKTKKAVVNGFKKSVAATKVAYQRVSAPIRKAFTGK
jgi:hypothetical protein